MKDVFTLMTATKKGLFTIKNVEKNMSKLGSENAKKVPVKAFMILAGFS